MQECISKELFLKIIKNSNFNCDFFLNHYVGGLDYDHKKIKESILSKKRVNLKKDLLISFVESGDISVVPFSNNFWSLFCAGYGSEYNPADLPLKFVCFPVDKFVSADSEGIKKDIGTNNGYVGPTIKNSFNVFMNLCLKDPSIFSKEAVSNISLIIKDFSNKFNLDKEGDLIKKNNESYSFLTFAHDYLSSYNRLFSRKGGSENLFDLEKMDTPISVKDLETSHHGILSKVIKIMSLFKNSEEDINGVKDLFLKISKITLLVDVSDFLKKHNITIEVPSDELFHDDKEIIVYKKSFSIDFKKCVLNLAMKKIDKINKGDAQSQFKERFFVVLKKYYELNLAHYKNSFKESCVGELKGSDIFLNRLSIEIPDKSSFFMVSGQNSLLVDYMVKEIKSDIVCLLDLAVDNDVLFKLLFTENIWQTPAQSEVEMLYDMVSKKKVYDLVNSSLDKEVFVKESAKKIKI